jgi:hypothetical protein
MKQLLTSTIYFVFFAGLFAQPTLEWQKNYGGTRNESAQFIEMAADGNYFVAGYTSSNNDDVDYHIGLEDVWILKMTPAGQVLWQKTLGGSQAESITNFKATSDGGCILTITTDSKNVDLVGIAPNDYPIWLVKLDADSETTWQRFFESAWSDEAVINQTADGNFLLAGQVDQNNGTAIHITKIDQQGASIWEKDIQTHDYHSCLDLVPTPDGGYLMAGQVVDIPPSGLFTDEWWVAKLNSTFDITWENVIPGNASDEAKKILISPDGGYLVAGVSNSTDGFYQGNNGDEDVWLVKYDVNGAVVWKHNFGGSKYEYFADIEYTNNGDLLLLAATQSSNGDISYNYGSYDFWLVKLNNLGIIQWETTFGGSNGDLPSDGMLLSSGQYLMVGKTGSLNGDVLENRGFEDLWIAQTIIIE